MPPQPDSKFLKIQQTQCAVFFQEHIFIYPPSSSLPLPSPLTPPQLCYIAQLDCNSVILLPQSSKWLNTSHCCCRLIPGPSYTSALLLNYKSTASAVSHKNNFMVEEVYWSSAALGRLNHWHKFTRIWITLLNTLTRAREGMKYSQGQGLTQGKAKGRSYSYLNHWMWVWGMDSKI